MTHVLSIDTPRISRDHHTSCRYPVGAERFRPAPQQCRHAPDRYRRVGAMVGNTPVLWVGEPFGRGERGFWAKLEGTNPGGMKDRPAMHMVERARLRGELLPGARIVESTSGTLGLGLALAGQVYRHPVTLVTDPGMEPIIRHMLAAYGARVDLVSQPHPVGGWQQARKDRVAELLAAEPDAWCPDQYSNPDNIDAYRPLALELLDQLGDIDVLVCSVGTGGHSAGVARVLRQHNPELELIGVDTIGSTIFGQPAGSRLMRGLGSSIYPRNVDYSAFTEVHWVAPAEAVWAARTLAATYYTSGGWSVGAVALVAGWAARTYPRGTRIAAVFPDGPQRYFDTIYNDDYCRDHHLLDTNPPSDPEEISTPTQAVVNRWTRCTTVVDPTATTTQPAEDHRSQLKIPTGKDGEHQIPA
ncbi:cysteine synthase a CysK2 [Mycobacterium intracellulare subsp. chimaera]|nr:cysteine synthase a CysK2 [Mycobacterium intracellulare subsp. chimaera]ASL20577.1 cysteine synthase a CysK2 [Mycobacterium intracellulare subsp. chimaera]ASQ85711.1 pyridoxal-5'-phosphate-dependent protein subunit beta [Mycobacterium intracellulare subsp. chimaera]MCV7327800.1 PLP-dependent cysteine synthase family protein [Mycobacterium intracellulare subsp. chimaera]QGK48217.1 pyridoxal-phosphate dependent enzyme [Mycobacterium intracellulare subsp. chimaera]